MDDSAAPWLQTVAAIRSFDMPTASWATGRRRSTTRDKLPDWSATSLPTIGVLERPTRDSVVISWCDACSGRYGYQKWRLFNTRRRGVCVLSGRAIEIDDSVYSPQLLGSTPGNAAAMILADCLDAVDAA
ncbi:hypothetical protein WM28_34225 [Burkholderia ubonensis]|uniref:DUF3331 domain-containing protein n=1 Tax=Burkholderia ubonensis TaxID=101571 RepID=UPI00075FCA41|nr:DUF3331 domain-containing protein [Burkholderia ubonensis]KWO58091.1 hypothetical protein WM28_34225 [Burkholderia ubonensis]